MDRRAFLKTATGAAALAATGGLATPAISQRAAARTLRFVPQADLANFDPIWGTQYVVRNASAMVWDTLYGMDEKLQPQRQMAEHEEVSADGLIWTFRLRPGLKFHDGEKVLAKDVVASLDRWTARDQMGLLIRAVQQELTAVDDRTVKWVLKKPFPKMLLALGKISTPIAFIMPERIAKSDPFKQITEYIGSGPMRFVSGDWVPGARAAFEKFADYMPRQETASWLAGGKRMQVDRVEWALMPDQATAAAALQSGEIDWWENPISDLVPLLRKNRNVAVDIADPLGNIGSFRMNHLYPPFNDVRARRAVLMAMSQEDYMRAIVGDDDNLWKPLPGFFTPGTPLYTEEGGEILKGPRDLDGAKKRLADVPHLARRGGLRESGGRHRRARERRQGVVRLAECPRGRGAGLGLVRGQELGRGESRNRAAQQGRARRGRFRADRFLLNVPSVAQERERRRQRAAAVLLGRGQ